MHRGKTKISLKIIIFLFMLDILLLYCSYSLKDTVKMDPSNKNSITVHSTQESTDRCDSLLVNTYLTRIIEASDEFYKEYYAILPIVNYYSIQVKAYLSDSRLSQITFTSLPYLGPHDTIGIDEITFTADYLGNVELKSFEHLESYHLPDNLRNLELKEFPEHYYKN